jgi:protein-L-isoaspartate(D-aspartate) O-methyltransferase
MTATSSAVEWQLRARELATALTAEGAITDMAWRKAFEQTPRHVFAPRFWALDEHNAPARLIDGANPDQHGEWLSTVYSDRFLATRWTLKDGARMVTSSASQPSLVARMLHLLDLRNGQRMLEIGTGTGFNTALLCHRVGTQAVASVDIDPVLVAEATDRLARIGYTPLLVAGDGANGLVEAAPFDRILSTCASPGIPAAWIDQLADGGVIVAPFTVGGALGVLAKTGPGEVTGHLDSEQAWFMPLRPDNSDPMPEGLLVDLPEAEAFCHHGTAQMDPDAFADPDFRLWLCLHLPRGARVVDQVGQAGDGFARTGVVVHTAEHRADVRFPDDSGGLLLVEQDERRLFDTVEAAWQAWLRHGRPSRRKVGITARADGSQNAFLDSPESGLVWPLPVS